MVPWPCAMHRRPILEDVAACPGDVLDVLAAVLTDADGGRMPVGFGSLDDAVDTSLLIDLSDGAGDGARAAAGSVSLGVSLIFKNSIL